MRSIGARVRMAVAACALLAGCAQIERPGPLASRDVRSGYFFSGGEYVGTGAGRHMSGQMYVEYRIPEKVRRPYPIVMIHGGPGGTHASFLEALPLADERAVILYDQLETGRSDRPGNPILYRTTVRFDRVFGLEEGRHSLPLLEELGDDLPDAAEVRDRLQAMAATQAVSIEDPGTADAVAPAMAEAAAPAEGEAADASAAADAAPDAPA